MSSCLLIQKTSKHLGHNSSAHYSGQATKHACSFSSFQLAQRTSRVKSWTRKTEDSLSPWTSGSQFFFSCTVILFYSQTDPCHISLWLQFIIYPALCKMFDQNNNNVWRIYSLSPLQHAFMSNRWLVVGLWRIEEIITIFFLEYPTQMN